jgi:hypothetical protein
VAKRGRRARAASLDGLVDQLQKLDKQRVAVIEQIRAATNRLLSGESPFPWRKNGRAAGTPADGEAAAPRRRRKRRKMSKEARERIAAAQRERWARQRAAEGKKTGKAAKGA